MKRALFLSAAAFVTAPAHAQEVGAAAPPEVEAVVVTAARSEQPLAETPASITVIDRETLERRQALIVADELARTPGVAVNRNGGPGGVTSVRIRGAESDHTVVLIDGVKLNDPASVGGGFDFATLLTGEVERIEVLRGPQSVLYGSQAIGGVVNVLTGHPEGRSTRLSVEGGSRETGYIRGSTAFGTERVRIRLGAGAFTTEGVSAFNEDRGGQEPDGFRQTHVSARADVALTEVLALDLRAYRAESRTEFDGFAPPTFSLGDTAEFGRRDETVAYAGLNYAALEGRFRNRLGFAFTDLTRDNFGPQGPTFGSEGRNGRLEYQGVLELPREARLTFGAETERSRIQTDPTAFSPGLERDVRLDSVYAQGSAGLAPGVIATAGLRRDEHETFGGATTGQAGLLYARGATTFRANYGGGFKAPSLFQLYSQFGNLALEPEAADGVDLGVEHRLGERFSASATVFARDTKNQIDFASCFSAPSPLCADRRFGYYANLDRTEARGLELAAAARPVDALTLNLAYTYTDTENTGEGDPNRGLALPRRPEHTAYAEADYRFANGLAAGVGVQHVGQRFDDAANRFRLEAYTLVDVRAAYPLRQGLELFGRVENLLDEEYEDVQLYGTPGRGGFVGLRASF